jgi:hypothetical protein
MYRKRRKCYLRIFLLITTSNRTHPKLRLFTTAADQGLQ